MHLKTHLARPPDQISTMKSLLSILPTSRRRRFQSALISHGFHIWSASSTDKEAVGVRASSDCSKQLRKTTEEDQEADATMNCKQLLLMRLAWIPL